MTTRRTGSAVAVAAAVFVLAAGAALSAERSAMAGGRNAEASARATVEPTYVSRESVAAGEAIPQVAGGTSGACPAGTVEIEGDYCPTLEQKCVKWMDPEGTNPRRCAEFAPSGACQTATVHKHVCMDRFEYPNTAGRTPVVMKTWHEAAAACKADGKRLCSDSEWTLACEGPQHLPYPYGLTRDANACNIDKPHPDVNERALANPRTRDAEVARLWQGEASGARAACVSAYGVADMTGNVDEWVVNETGQGFRSGLKGGYWGPVRDRCRPMTTAHNEDFSFYQIGFRCCADAEGETAAKAPARGARPTAGARASR